VCICTRPPTPSRTGTQVEKTFRAGEPVNTADISRREGQFTYAEGDEYIFMDQQSFEETRLPKDDWAVFLKEGMVSRWIYTGPCDSSRRLRARKELPGIWVEGTFEK